MGKEIGKEGGERRKKRWMDRQIGKKQEEGKEHPGIKTERKHQEKKQQKPDQRKKVWDRKTEGWAEGRKYQGGWAAVRVGEGEPQRAPTMLAG